MRAGSDMDSKKTTNAGKEHDVGRNHLCPWTGMVSFISDLSTHFSGNRGSMTGYRKPKREQPPTVQRMALGGKTASHSRGKATSPHGYGF